MLKDARDRVLIPQMRDVVRARHARREGSSSGVDCMQVVRIGELGLKLAENPMMCRTHGQPASPSTMGKELAVFASRLHRQLQHVAAVEVTGGSALQTCKYLCKRCLESLMGQ